MTQSNIVQLNPDLDIGTTLLGRYRLVRLLSSSQIGASYQCHDAFGDSPLHLRVAGPSAGNAGRLILRQYYELAKEYNEPHLVPELHLWDSDDWVFCIREWVDGRTLETELRLAKTLKKDPFRRLANGLLEAVVWLHQFGIVAGNITPDRILLLGDSAETDWVSLRLLDAGLTLPPNPGFASVNVQQGLLPVPQDDLHAIGQILLLSLGVKPTPSPDPAVIARQVRKLDSRASVVGRVLAQMTSDNAVDQFGSAADAQEALMEAIDRWISPTGSAPPPPMIVQPAPAVSEVSVSEVLASLPKVDAVPPAVPPLVLEKPAVSPEAPPSEPAPPAETERAESAPRPRIDQTQPLEYPPRLPFPYEERPGTEPIHEDSSETGPAETGEPASATADVQVEEQAAEEEEIALAEPTGSISVIGRPAGAAIYLDGVAAGTLPVRIAEQPFGQHHLRLEHPGFRRVELVIKTTGDIELAFRLEPLDDGAETEWPTGSRPAYNPVGVGQPEPAVAGPGGGRVLFAIGSFPVGLGLVASLLSLIVGLALAGAGVALSLGPAQVTGLLLACSGIGGLVTAQVAPSV